MLTRPADAPLVVCLQLGEGCYVHACGTLQLLHGLPLGAMLSTERRGDEQS